MQAVGRRALKSLSLLLLPSLLQRAGLRLEARTLPLALLANVQAHHRAADIWSAWQGALQVVQLLTTQARKRGQWCRALPAITQPGASQSKGAPKPAHGMHAEPWRHTMTVCKNNEPSMRNLRGSCSTMAESCACVRAAGLAHARAQARRPTCRRPAARMRRHGLLAARMQGESEPARLSKRRPYGHAMHAP